MFYGITWPLMLHLHWLIYLKNRQTDDARLFVGHSNMLPSVEMSHLGFAVVWHVSLVQHLSVVLTTVRHLYNVIHYSQTWLNG